MRIKDANRSNLAAVSAIIVNYNAGSLLVDSVRSALTQARQVVVIDNDSTDSSLQILESACAGESRLKIVRNGDNVGFAAACNLGVQHSDESYVLFLNPDCVLAPGSLQRMLTTLSSNMSNGMVGGLLLDPDGTEQGGGRRAVPTPWRSLVRVFGLTRLASRWPKIFSDFYLHEQPLPESPIMVEAISGALMLMKKEVLRDIGLWDAKYFLHCEDLDLCMRFRQKGWNVIFDPAAPAIHAHGACSQSRPVFVEWHKHKGMMRFYRKFFRHQYPGFLMWLVVLGVWLRFAAVATIKFYKKNKQVSSLPEINAKSSHKFNTESSDQSGSFYVEDTGRVVAVVGASSMVGQALLSMLTQSGTKVIAYSRSAPASQVQQNGVEWRDMLSLQRESNLHDICEWIWLAPIRALPEQLPHMKRAGAKRVVAVSTTSRFTKQTSSSPAERRFVEELIAAEEKLQFWAQENSVGWTLLRPTLIYGFGKDKNISVIAQFIRRFHVFPLLGKANGLRQPIHAKDVAAACKASLESTSAANHAYNISGAEVLSYREMITRIFEALAIYPRFFAIPLWLFSAGVAVVRLWPQFYSWSPAMAERMNQDMIFDYKEAKTDFGFSPQLFRLNACDLKPEVHDKKS